MELLSILSILLWICIRSVKAKSVFAHYMVTNSQNYSLSIWQDEIQLAQDAHIDAFALNMAVGDPANAPGVANAFSAAESLGFQLFFSFDYAGNGPWAASDVINLLNQYGSSSAYFHYNGQPFVSTFEGPANADDWNAIKADTGCFFIPSWSSLGAKAALALGVADGLFSWAAWPWGDLEMNTYVDASYLQYLNGMPYMMPAAPWFYTNLPGYDKNWLWAGDHLWYDRWEEILFVQPDFVEIVTWNDWGECHYIGPLRENAFAAFDIGRAPFNYADGMPHDGWRLFLPYLIDTYKNGIATITEEGLVAWSRQQPSNACNAGGTSGNTASQFQIEFPPAEIVQDAVFYSALLGSSASVSVSIGGVTQTGSWKNTPDGGVGVYHGSVPFNGITGEIIVTISRGGSVIAQTPAGTVSNNCDNGYENWNAYVGYATASQGTSATPGLDVADQVCIEGTAPGNFEGMCNFCCGYGYCPIGACYCTAMGAQKTLPPQTGISGYPLNGEDPSYLGLCAFACEYGYCPSDICGTDPNPNLVVPTVSPFLPPACTAGTGSGTWAGLCSYACNFGFCPIEFCQCTGEGALILPPGQQPGVTGVVIGGDDAGLCAFACSRGYCPSPCIVIVPDPPVTIGWTAFGDSYSAGVGAGADYQNSGDCRRRTNSYPVQLDGSSLFTSGPNHDFQFVSCSGAVINNVLSGGDNSQVDQFTADSVVNKEVATLSIGGNDIGFVDVLDACIVDWSFFGPSCAQALQQCDFATAGIPARIQSALQDILAASSNNGGSANFRVYVTGYPQFFNADTTDCDNYSFGFWSSKIKLTQALRTSINARVTTLNTQISAGVDALNAAWGTTKAVFVNYDSYFEGHRFCEEGVVEPDGHNPNTWFFLINGDDSPGFQVPEPDKPVNLTPSECDTILNSLDVDWGEYMLCAIQSSLSQDPTLEPQPWTGVDNSNDIVWIPESYGKMFHPKSDGYTAVVQAIENAVQNTPSPTAVKVLIMFRGTSDAFDTFIAGLPMSTVLNTKIEQPNVDIRGYVTWLSIDIARGLSKQAGVVGVSYEPIGTATLLNNDKRELEKKMTDENVLQKRQTTTSDLNKEINSPWHLQTLSMPPLFTGTAYWKYPDYLYDPAGGQGVNIYIMDTGINPTHDEFQGYDLSGAWWASGMSNIDDVNHHGSCMASCAAGRSSGAAKAPKIIPVRFWSGQDQTATPGPLVTVAITAQRVFESLQFILNDVISNGKKGKAVVLFANSYANQLFVGPLSDEPMEPSEDEILMSDPWYQFVQLFAENDVVVVTSVGNSGSTDDSDSDFDVPTRYARPGAVADNSLIVVGAINSDNTRWSMSNLWPSVLATYAPGVDIPCATYAAESNTDYPLRSGTSMSAAMTAGMIATYLVRADLAGLQVPGSVAANIKQFLIDAARFASDSDPQAGTLDHTTSYNYVPCSDMATSSALFESLATGNHTNGNIATSNTTNSNTIEDSQKNNTALSHSPKTINGTKITIDVNTISSPYSKMASYVPDTTSSTLSSQSQNLQQATVGISSSSTASPVPSRTSGNATAFDSVSGWNRTNHNTTSFENAQLNHTSIIRKRDGGSFESAPIRRAGMLVTVGAGASCVGYNRPNQFEYLGCWVDSDDPNRILQDKFFQPSAMTIESCAALCNTYKYFGVEWGQQCFCGNNRNGGTQVAESQCNMPCAGNANENCGQSLKMNLYLNPNPQPTQSVAPPTPTPTIVTCQTLCTGPGDCACGCNNGGDFADPCSEWCCLEASDTGNNQYFWECGSDLSKVCINDRRSLMGRAMSGMMKYRKKL